MIDWLDFEFKNMHTLKTLENYLFKILSMLWIETNNMYVYYVASRAMGGFITLRVYALCRLF